MILINRKTYIIFLYDYVMKLVNFYKNSFKAYFLNEKAIDELDDNYSWSTALVAGIILSFIFNTINLFLSFIDIDFFSLIPLIISSILLYPLCIFVGVLIIWILLKIFGGKAKYGDLLKFLISMSIIPTIIITVLLFFKTNFLFSISFYIIFMIFISIIVLWSFYLSIIIYSLLSQISKLRTFFALSIIPLFIIILVIYYTYNILNTVW
jgi:hypothetical protein